MKVGCVLAAALASLSCGARIDNVESVRTAVLQGVASRGVSVENMDIQVRSVSFRNGEADAVVSFAPKGGNPASGLTMRYTLQRQGDHWVIKDRSRGDLARHTGGGMAQPGEGGQMSPAAPLPPEHPPVGPGERAK